MPTKPARKIGILWIALIYILAVTIVPGRAKAQRNTTLAATIQKIMDRPEYKHANFGIEFYALDSGTVVYAVNPDKLFVPASTTKILTEGALLANLGREYRFHTRIYATGPIDRKGR